MKARRERLETRIIRLSTDIFLFPASSLGCALWPDLWATVQTLNFHECATNPETAKGSARGGSWGEGPGRKEERGGSERNEWEAGEPGEGSAGGRRGGRGGEGRGDAGRGPESRRTCGGRGRAVYPPGSVGRP